MSEMKYRLMIENGSTIMEPAIKGEVGWETAWQGGAGEAYVYGS